ncbi:substrate-binding domain-containing protein, partial [bacterium]|nr:substrate-binding domain-containing protein [bacterium]
NIDNKLDAQVLASENVRIPFVGPDNRKGAKLVGDYLARDLKSGDEVVLIEGVQGAFNAIQRKKGFEDSMNAAGMKIAASHSADWHMDRANQVVSSLLPSHPNLKAILCANDSMALGAVAAMEEAGKTGEILVVGFDNISAVQQLIRERKILATADQHADQLAVFGIEYALTILRDKSLPQDRETPVDLITLETLGSQK